MTGTVLVLGTFIAVTVAPGPANLAVSACAMAQGRRAAMRMALGLGLGLAFWGGITGLGLSAVLLASPPVLIALKLAGGAYLLWLAVQSACAALSPSVGPALMDAPRRAVWRGLALNLLNPKAVLAWTAALSLGLPSEAQPDGLWPLILACALIGLGNYAAYALAFSLSGIRALYARLRRWIEAVAATVFSAAGLGLILWRVRPA